MAFTPRGMHGWIRANADRFDVVLLHDVYSAVSVLGARGAAGAGVPYALQPLGTLSPAPERGRSLAKRAFLRLWGQRTVAGAAALVYSGDHERRDLVAAGGSADRLVRMPLPLELPDVPATDEAAQPTVAFVGRLHPIKRVDRLIEAVALARRDVPDLRLEIVGPGDRHGGELAALAARLGLGDAVAFRGYVTVEEKLRILARAHVSALLSASEGLPMAALEAMACATPVVLSEGCHLPEVHDRGGIVVPGGAQDAAAAIVELLRDAGLRQRLGAGAVAFAHDFRREVVMPQMIAMLEGLATPAPRAPTTVTR
jgi:glycosyltransferase involved in cell wall biosynthesis